MQKVKYTWLVFALMLVNMACSCSSSLNDDGDDEPQVVLSDISGTWTEYAYKCSDGYFVDISGTGCVYEFARPDAFTKYQIKDGEKEILTQGFNPRTHTGCDNGDLLKLIVIPERATVTTLCVKSAIPCWNSTAFELPSER